MTNALTKADTYSKNIDLNQYIFNFNFNFVFLSFGLLVSASDTLSFPSIQSSQYKLPIVGFCHALNLLFRAKISPSLFYSDYC
jgi:hypothetical protein